MSQLVDFFVVCGLHARSLEKELTTGHTSYTPPLIRSFPVKVLSHYPENRPGRTFDAAAITTLCMPDGLKFKKNLKDPHQKTTHTFCITKENGSRTFGTVLTYYELTTDLKVINSFESFQSKYLERRRTQLPSNLDYNFSITEDRLYAPKCLCVVTSSPVFQSLKAYLEQLFAVTVGQASSELPVECYLYNLLYEVSLPDPGKTLHFMGPLGSFLLTTPTHLELRPCDYSFKQLFELLGIKNVLRLLTCLLLEHQVLLKSSDLERLSLVAQCATALLWPFSWPHVFVPFLPASQRGFLDAPVPYLMGLRMDITSQENNIYSDLSKVASLCIVNIDRGTLDCPEEIPRLPDQGIFMLRLSEKILEHGVKVSDVVERQHSPDLSPPGKPSVIEALRLIEPFKDNVKSNKMKKYLSDSTVTNPHIPNLINITQRVNLKSPTLSLDEGAYDLEDEDHTHQPSEWDYMPDKTDMSFTADIRELFAEYFVEHFANYEKFIIMPKQSYQQWQKNREQFQNFDKTAYLSDQPLISQAFYSAFLETSIFTIFVDDKIIALYQPEQCKDSLAMFDSHIERHLDKSGLAKPPTPGYRTTSLSSEGEEDRTLGFVEETAPFPHTLTKSGRTSTSPNPAHSPSHLPHTFPELDSELLQLAGEVVQQQPSPEPPPMSSRQRSRDNLLADRAGRMRPVSAGDQHRKLKQSGGSGTFWFSSHSHAKFVSQLMRESRLRVKHMLGSSRESETMIEENTHIAYLCDLLERIWGHGLKKRESKSPLWTHLMAYAEKVGKQEFDQGASPAHPPLSSCLRTGSMSSLTHISTSPGVAGSSGGEESPRLSIKSHFRRKRFQSPQLRSSVEAILHPPPSSLVSDLLVVHRMSELKTDVGRARGWVRLALEKKSLSRHLSELLAHEELTSRKYREYAFIRTDEEREQFLYHLLTLTAREFSCFTSVFLRTTMKYHVLVVAEGKHFGLSTACLYVHLAGEFKETGVIELPRGEYETEFEYENLGPLTCLRIGHDNTGLTPSLFVEMVLVHNVTTGQTYRFNCGRLFARSDDDGSVERFLVAEKVPLTLAKTGTMSALDVDTVLPASPGRRRVTKKYDEDAGISSLNLELKQIMDKIRTLGLSKKQDKIEMLGLIHRQSGFLKCMDKVLSAGFKMSRKFSKRLHVWDLLERVREQLAAETSSPPSMSTDGSSSPSLLYHRPSDGGQCTPYHEADCKDLFQKAVCRINTNNPNIGKDEKVMQFLCLGLRDHLLRHWLALMANSPAISNFYELNSYLRDSVLLQNLLDTFHLTLALPIKLEPLFIQGL